VRRSIAFIEWLSRGPLRRLHRLALSALILTSATSPRAAAQGPAVADPASTTSVDSLLGEAPVDQFLLGAEPVVPAAYDAVDFGTEAPPLVRPVNWISGPYLRGGVNFVIGEGIFDQQQDVGYGISGGFRQPLGPEIGGDRFFFDLGGSYQDSYGRATPVVIDGRQIATTVDITDPNDIPSQSSSIRNDAFQTTLEEVRRGSLHAAIGWFWGPGIDHRAQDPQLRFATRLGGRVGHARGGYTEERLIQPPSPTQIGNFRTTFEIDPVFYKQTDTYGGLFVGTEAILLQRQYSFGHFQWTLDGEFANDWINIGNIWKDSLGTASVMMGFMLSR
jgi:hypothetical protein